MLRLHLFEQSLERLVALYLFFDDEVHYFAGGAALSVELGHGRHRGVNVVEE